MQSITDTGYKCLLQKQLINTFVYACFSVLPENKTKQNSVSSSSSPLSPEGTFFFKQESIPCGGNTAQFIVPGAGIVFRSESVLAVSGE